MEMLDAACLSACSLSGKRLLALTVPTAVIFVDVRHKKKNDVHAALWIQPIQKGW